MGDMSDTDMRPEPEKRTDEMIDFIALIPGDSWRSRVGGVPVWSMQAVRKTALMLGEQAVEYVTGEPPADDGGGKATLTVFSAELVVYSSINLDDDGFGGRAAVCVLHRRTLRTITLSDHRVTSEPSGKRWPYEQQDLLLHYEGLANPVNVVPGPLGPNHRLVTVVQDFVGTVIADLSRS